MSEKSMGTGKSISYDIFYIVIVILLSVFSVTIILPFLNVIALSFNGGKDATGGGVWFWPRSFTLNNYIEVFKDPSIITGYKITIARTVIGTALSVLLTAMAAFALKFKELPGHKFFTTIVVVTMLFGGNIIANYIVRKELGLLNSFLVYIIPGLYSAWNIILMRSFFETLGNSLEESAKIDGCGYFRIFFQIVLPLSAPVVAVIALYNGVGHWSDWYTGVFYIQKRELRPIASILQEMLTRQLRLKNIVVNNAQAARAAQNMVTGDSLKMSTVVITMFPIMCIYPFIQKYFTKGIMVGALKG